jgi:LPS-assembly lipoprotein
LSPIAKKVLRALALAAFIAQLSACGFHLRGQQTLPFATLAVPGNSPLTAEIKRAVVSGSNAKIVDEPNEADAVLSILRESSEKVILSLNSQGRVREYQLRYLVRFKVSQPKGADYLPPSSIVLTRDMTFNDQVLSKEGEETLLYNEMRSDFVQQVMRRMAAIKPLPPPTALQ